MLNESRFVRAWCANVRRWADDAVVIDTGSTDGTVETLESNGVKVYHEEVKTPFVWPEAEIRNRFRGLTLCDWIVYMDADELVGEKFIGELPVRVLERLPFVRFPQLTFWGGMDTLRVRTLRSFDEWRHWYPSNTKVKMYRRSTCSWAGGHSVNGCNPYLRWRDFGKWSQRICAYSEAPFYHYHYAFPRKRGDLRAGGIDPAIRKYHGVHPTEAELIDRS